jgi:hypothetical protein
LGAAAIAGFTAVLGASALAQAPVDLPPNAVPGKCYQRVLIPEVVETYQEQIVDTPERTEIRVIPAVFADKIEQIVVREARTEYTTVAATYRTVTETVVIRPASFRIETVPARYETISERVLVREAYTMWQRGVPANKRPTAPGMTKVLPTGEVLCLIEVPAEYATVTRQVLREPAREVRIEIPAETRVITRQVIDQPGRVDQRVIPAEYGTVNTRVLVTPERTETYTIPATYKMVSKKRVTTAARFEWQEFECETPAPPPPPRYAPPPKAPPPAPRPRYTPPAQSTCDEVDVSAVTVRDVQAALSIRRYYSGARNGVYNGETSAALRRFQSENGLAPGAINAATLRALGVPFQSRCGPTYGERG